MKILALQGYILRTGLAFIPGASNEPLDLQVLETTSLKTKRRLGFHDPKLEPYRGTAQLKIFFFFSSFAGVTLGQQLSR